MGWTSFKIPCMSRKEKLYKWVFVCVSVCVCVCVCVERNYMYFQNFRIASLIEDDIIK